MTRPQLTIFDPPSGLTAEALADQVRLHGYVLFDTTRPHARALSEAAADLLSKDGIEIVHGAGGPPNFTSFLLAMGSDYSFTDCAAWVTECDQQRSSDLFG